MDQDDLEFANSVRTLLEGVPDSIRDFILNNLSHAVQELIEKYTLHVDQGGILERELLLMLVGEEEPSGFSKELVESGIPAEIVRGIITDVNETIFKKLQATEVDSVLAAKPPYRREPARVDVPVMQVGVPAPTASAVPAPSVQPPHFNLIQPQPAAQAYTAPAAPEVRTMASDMQAMQHPEAAPQPVHLAVPVSAPAPAVPVPNTPSTMPSIPNPAHVSPARSFQTASVPFTSVPTASQPVIEARSMNAAPAGTSYSSDPYREPIE